MAKIDYRQLIYRKLVETLNTVCFFDLDDLADASDTEKAEFMIEKRNVRQELTDIANGSIPSKAKKKKSAFDLSRYKTHDGEMKGNPDEWKKAAKVILNVNDENCLTTLGLTGVPATESDLKAHYRSLMLKCHPDRGGDPDEAARINAAYELAVSLFFSKPKMTDIYKDGKVTRKDYGKLHRLKPQLLTPITEDEAVKYLTDDLWCSQEKKDGKHLIIKKIENTIIAANKQGLETSIPKCVESAILAFFGDDICRNNVVLDGELIGDKFYIFDILEYKDNDLRIYTYQERYNTIKRIFPDGQYDCLIHVPAYFSTKDKTDFFFEMKKAEKEGVVFKRLDVPFSEGRPETGGNMVKCKFWATLSAIIAEEQTGKNSFISYVFDEKGDRVYLGRCTTIGKNVPRPGDVVEIKYLYVGAGGRLVQQVYLDIIRDDVSPEECTTKQLKYKAKD